MPILFTDSTKLGEFYLGVGRLGSLGTLEDSGSGVVAVPLTQVQSTLNDVGYGETNYPTIKTNVHLLELGATTELVDVYPIGDVVLVHDSATGTTQVQFDNVIVALSDFGTTQTNTRIGSSTLLADSGYGASTLSVQQFKSVTDILTLDDFIVLSSITNLADVGSGADVVRYPQTSIPVIDGGYGTEENLYDLSLRLEDYGTAIKLPDTSRLGVAQVGLMRLGVSGGGEFVNVYVGVPPLADNSLGVDDFLLVQHFLVQDSGSGLEDLLLKNVVMVTDTATGEYMNFSISELLRPPFRVILNNPRYVVHINDMRLRAVLWP